MNRKPYYLFLLLSLLLVYPWDAMAQYRNKSRRASSNTKEKGMVIAIGGGVAAVRSDICGTGNCNDFGPNVSVGAIYKLSPYLALSGNLDYLRLGAAEKDPQQPLNLSFEAEVIEVAGSVMLNLLDSYAGSGRYRSSRKRFVVPYVRAGIGAIYYTSTAFPTDQGSLDESQTTYDPVRDYPAVAAVVPIGFGMRFRVNDEFSIAPELAYRLTTTDNLDNVDAAWGDPGRKDDYATFAVKLQYTPVIKNKLFTRKPSN